MDAPDNLSDPRVEVPSVDAGGQDEMRRRSRPTVLVALAFPGLLSLLTLGLLLLLIPQAPDAIVMQWSGEGASRFAPPGELLFIPAIAMIVSVVIWSVAPSKKPRDARIGVVIGNSVNAMLNSSALALLGTQLSGAATDAFPTSALAPTLILTALVALITVFAARERGR